MSTIQELLNKVSSYYPHANTDAVVVGFMNDCQNELSPYFGLIAEDHHILHTKAYQMDLQQQDNAKEMD